MKKPKNWIDGWFIKNMVYVSTQNGDVTITNSYISSQDFDKFRSLLARKIKKLYCTDKKDCLCREEVLKMIRGQ